VVKRGNKRMKNRRCEVSLWVLVVVWGFVCLVRKVHASAVPEIDLFLSHASFDEEGETEDALHDVLRDGEYAANFASCRSTALAMDSEHEEVCVVVDGFTAFSSFAFAFSDPTLDVASEPIVTSSMPDVVVPRITKMLEDHDDLMGSFTVGYTCIKPRKGSKQENVSKIQALITVTIDYGNDHSVEFSYVKACVFGSLDFLTVKHLHTAGQNRAKPSEFGLETLKVDTTAVATQISVELQHPASSVDLLHPELTSGNNKTLEVSLRGALRGDTLQAETPLELSVLYDCHQAGEVPVELKLRLPPFDDVVLRWTKMCEEPSELEARWRRAEEQDLAAIAAVASSEEHTEKKNENAETDGKKEEISDPLALKHGKPYKGFQMGFMSYQMADLVHNGEVKYNYRMTMDDLASESVPRRTRLLPVYQNVQEMFLWITRGSARVAITDLQLTLDRPDVLAARFITPRSFTSTYMDAGGGVIGDSTKKLMVRMVCKAEGVVKILVTVAMEHGYTFEFGFAKECDQPKIHRRVSVRRRVAVGFVWFCIPVFVVAVIVAVIRTLRDAHVQQSRPFQVIPKSQAPRTGFRRYFT